MTQAFNLSQFANRLNTTGQINPTSAFSAAIPINQGGTNNASLAVTAGGVIYTDGSKMVNVGAGSANQVLTSNGAGAPTWQTPSGGGFSNMQIYTSGSGAWTIPAGKTTCMITVIGGGGAGGTGSGSFGGHTIGGAGGGYAIQYYSGITPGNTINYTVGGASGTSSVSSGTQSITTISATGGSAGGGNSLSFPSPGVGSGAQINSSGFYPAGPPTSGQNAGASSLWARGGAPVGSGGNNIAGNAGTGFGSGGSGVFKISTFGNTVGGGAGSNGAIIIQF